MAFTPFVCLGTVISAELPRPGSCWLALTAEYVFVSVVCNGAVAELLVSLLPPAIGSLSIIFFGATTSCGEVGSRSLALLKPYLAGKWFIIWWK